MPEAGGAADPAAAENADSAAGLAAASAADFAGRPAANGAPAKKRIAPARTWVPMLVCALAGVAHALSFAPYYLPWLALITLGVVLGFALWAPRPGSAFAIGWAFGCGWLGLGLSWIYISLHHYGELSAPFAALAAGTLAAGLALLPASALAGAAACGKPSSARRAAAIVAAWTLSEWLRGVLLTGMPWLSTGYAHTDGPLAGYAPVLGVYGVGAVAAVVVLLPLWDWQSAAGRQGHAQRRLAAGAMALLIPLVLLGLGQYLRGVPWSQDAGAPIRVRLVQGNIAQDTKFAEGGLDEAVGRYLPALHADAMHGVTDHASHAGTPAPDLIVLPESAFPVPVNELPDEIISALSDQRQRDGAALIFGAFVVEPRFRYYNSAIGLGSEDVEPQRYSKRHLVPFGEFIPFGFRWFVDLLHIPIGDQEQGQQFQAPMALAGQRIAVNICFEDLFGGEILDAWHDPKQAPTLLLNLSNLGWFDDSIALPQHLQISRMRALETARPLLRATNTGITAIIDARGRVTAQLPPLTQALLDGSVQGTSGNTPFIRAGNRPILLLSALILLIAATTAAAAPRRPADKT
jgi:apolipoprotein N-acyltransferase